MTRYLLFCSLLFTALLVQAQYSRIVEAQSLPAWRWNQIDFGLGAANDHYPSMSLQEMTAFAKNPEEIERDMSMFTEETSTAAFGAVLLFNIGFSPLDKQTLQYRDDRELRIGMGLYSDREAMLTYKNEDLDTSLVYCSLQSEFSLEVAYLFKGTWGKKDRWHWYWGAGMNAATSLSEEMILISGKYFDPELHPSEQPEEQMTMETYAGTAVNYMRMYVPYGIGHNISKNWILGFDFRTGIGVQFIEGRDTNFIKKTGTFTLGVKHRFR